MSLHDPNFTSVFSKTVTVIVKRDTSLNEFIKFSGTDYLYHIPTTAVLMKVIQISIYFENCRIMSKCKFTIFYYCDKYRICSTPL